MCTVRLFLFEGQADFVTGNIGYFVDFHLDFIGQFDVLYGGVCVQSITSFTTFYSGFRAV